LNNKKLLLISGPTATGKSDLAINIAKKIKGEIINADSMQVYKDLKIITSRPVIEKQQNIKHHLYGYKSGNVRYNVYDWCVDCEKKIKEIINKKKYPIIVGGTGLYFLSLLKGISDIPSIPEKIKIQSNQEFDKIGIKQFCEKVQKIDPLSLKKINKNDSQRLKRIWEVYNYTGNTLNDWNNKRQHKFIKDYIFNLILILPERKKIYEQCNNRFLKMIEEGAIEEVKKLLDKKYNNSLPIMKAHGVPEIINYILGKISLEKAIKKSQQITRNYAKRQITWWRGSKLKPSHLFNDFPRNSDINEIKFLKNYTN